MKYLKHGIKIPESHHLLQEMPYLLRSLHWNVFFPLFCLFEKTSPVWAVLQQLIMSQLFNYWNVLDFASASPRVRKKDDDNTSPPPQRKTAQPSADGTCSTDTFVFLRLWRATWNISGTLELVKVPRKPSRSCWGCAGHAGKRSEVAGTPELMWFVQRTNSNVNHGWASTGAATSQGRVLAHTSGLNLALKDINQLSLLKFARKGFFFVWFGDFFSFCFLCPLSYLTFSFCLHVNLTATRFPHQEGF